MDTPIRFETVEDLELTNKQKNCIETFAKSRSKDEILKIYGIYRTNCFENGVAINFARFNHSCCSNAEQMVNEGDLYLMPWKLTPKNLTPKNLTPKTLMSKDLKLNYLAL